MWLEDDGRAPQRAVVTGGAGFIGSWLCEKLLDLGITVVCVDDFSTGDPRNLEHLADTDNFLLMEHDVTRPFEITGPVQWVFHLASPASPVDFERFAVKILRTGSAGTENALRLAQSKNARFLLASTSEVYGEPHEHPQPETYHGNVDPIGPRSPYDEAKRYAEALTMAYHRTEGTDVTIARIFNTYGPRMRPDDGRIMPTFITQALKGLPLTVHGTGEQTRSLCYVDDTVAGLIAQMSHETIGPVNLGSPHELTVLEIAEAVADIVGVQPHVERAPLPSGDPTRRKPDISLARNLLGWHPSTALDEGLRRTVEWFHSRVVQPAPQS